MDIFGGSNTTGATAEKLGRKWKSFELNREYVASSSFRFVDDIDETTQCYEKIINEELVDFTVYSYVTPHLLYCTNKVE